MSRASDPAVDRRRGGAARRLIPPGCEAQIHLTLTDEYPLAQAQVIIEALSLGDAAEAS